jgi:hypothetical protein
MTPAQWKRQARRGASLDTLLLSFSVTYGQPLEYVPVYLSMCERWSDIRKLQNHPNDQVAQCAKDEWQSRLDYLRWLAREDRRITALPSNIKKLHNVCQQIWWKPIVIYPYHTPEFPLANCCIDADGQSLACFLLEGVTLDSLVYIVQIANERLSLFFENGWSLVDGCCINLKHLLEIMSSYVIGEPL